MSIPKSKEYIMLEGEGSDQTRIEWGDYANDGQHTTASSATFSCYASNFMARDISFKVPFSLHFNITSKSDTEQNSNTSGVQFDWYNFWQNTFNGILSSMSQAVAALVAGDKSAFYRCSFVGIQDTLCDLTGRHYYQDCYIEGALDFIFGQGQSIFEVFCYI